MPGAYRTEWAKNWIFGNLENIQTDRPINKLTDHRPVHTLWISSWFKEKHDFCKAQNERLSIKSQKNSLKIYLMPSISHKPVAGCWMDCVIFILNYS